MNQQNGMQSSVSASRTTQAYGPPSVYSQYPQTYFDTRRLTLGDRDPEYCVPNYSCPQQGVIRDEREWSKYRTSLTTDISRNRISREYVPMPSQEVRYSESSTQQWENQDRMVGLGILLEKDDGNQLMYVKSLIPSLAGSVSGQVQIGDTVTAIDNRSIEGYSLDDIKNLTLGREGTQCVLMIRRGYSSFPVTLTRIGGATRTTTGVEDMSRRYSPSQYDMSQRYSPSQYASTSYADQQPLSRVRLSGEWGTTSPTARSPVGKQSGVWDGTYTGIGGRNSTDPGLFSTQPRVVRDEKDWAPFTKTGFVHREGVPLYPSAPDRSSMGSTSGVRSMHYL